MTIHQASFWSTLFIAVFIAFILMTARAKADDPAVHGNHGHDWYANAELTPQAAARLNQKKCCAAAEVVRTRFRVDRTTAEDTWWYLDRVTNVWRQVPRDIIHFEQHAPDKQPTLFIWNGTEVCFFVPEEGI